MIPQHEIRDLLHFIENKKDLRTYIQELESGLPPEDTKIRQFLDLQEQWKAYPIFVRQIAPDLKKIEFYATHLPHRPKGNDIFPGETQISSYQQHYPPNSQSAFSGKTISYNPTSDDIHTFFTSKNIVGEEKNRELLLYAMLGKVNIGIESLPGSGKSALLHAAVRALPAEQYVVVHHATTGSLYANPQLQRASFLVIPELQKVFTPEIEEIIKNLAEGQDVTHTRTSADRTSIDTLRIEKKSILYSFAITNRHLKHQDEEFLRRFLVLHTDISTKQSREIMSNYALSNFSGCNSSQDSSFDCKTFESHVAHCLSSTAAILNPYFEYIISNFPPEIAGHLRVRSTIKYVDSLIKGATKFYQLGKPAPLMVFSSAYENERIMHLIEEPFLNHLYGFDVVDRAVLSLVREPRLRTDFNDEFQATYGSSTIIKKKLESSLERLAAQNYITLNTTIQMLNPLPRLTFKREEAVQMADSNMHKFYPEYRDAWFSQQTNEDCDDKDVCSNDGGR